MLILQIKTEKQTVSNISSHRRFLKKVHRSGLKTHAEVYGHQTLAWRSPFRPLSIGRAGSKPYSYRTVLTILISIVCQVSLAFEVSCFPRSLSAQGRLHDPETFLLVPPGCARDTVMRDMAHNPERASQGIPTNLPTIDLMFSQPAGFNPQREGRS